MDPWPKKAILPLQMEKQEKDLSGGLTTVLVARSDILQKHYKEAMEEWIRSLVGACAFIENDIKDPLGRTDRHYPGALFWF